MGSLTMSDGVVVASIEAIRSHFPALERKHRGRPVVYLDGPGGTQVPRVVVEAMADYLYRHNANTHWGYPTSNETDEALADARRVMGEFLNAGPDEVVFGPNMTSLTFHLGRALGAEMQEGDELVVTELDHHANSDPWRHLARERGLKVRTVRLDPETCRLDLEDLDRAVSGKTRLIAIGAASNAVGTITDVRRAVELAREVGALVFVDAVHYAPHRLVDVKAIGCDFLACSAYKFHGPHLGVMYAKRERVEGLPVPKLRPAPEGAPERLETGTQNHEGIVGAAAAVRFLASLAGDEGGIRERLERVYDAVEERSQTLFRRLWERLSALSGVRVYGPGPWPERTPTIAFTVRDLPSREVSRLLAEEALFASHGDFYATTVVERLGVAEQGLLRAGLACYSTSEEVDRLVEAVRRILDRT